jgi:hypothetical protein
VNGRSLQSQTSPADHRNGVCQSGAAALPFLPGDQVQRLVAPFSQAQFLPFAHLTLARLPGVTTVRDC